MSDKISKRIKKKPTSIVLSNSQFNYMNLLDTIGRSFDYYLEQLKKEYLHDIAVANGWDQEDDVELSIDLKSEAHELSVKPVDKPLQNSAG